MKIFKLLMQNLKDLNQEIKKSCNNNELNNKSPKSQNSLNSQTQSQIMKIINNLLNNSIKKFTNGIEKILFSKNPLPMNKNFYTTLAEISHEKLCFKTEIKSNPNLNKIMEDSLKEIFINTNSNLKHSNQNLNSNSISISNLNQIQNSFSIQNNYLGLNSTTSIFESQIRKRQDCHLFKEEDFRIKNDCDMSHFSDKSFDTFTEENFTIELLNRHSLNKIFSSNKSNQLGKVSLNLPYAKTLAHLSSESKKKKVRSSMSHNIELEHRNNRKNKIEFGFSNSANEEEKILLYKNKTMEKNLKKKYHSYNNVIKKEKEELKKFSDQSLKSNKKGKEDDSESEKSQNEEETHKNEIYENDTTKITPKEKISNLKIKTINSHVHNSDSEKSNLIKVSKLSNKKTDAKNNDCYIINNNIIVLDNKMILNKNEMIQEALNIKDKKDSNMKLEVKKLESKTNLKVHSNSSTGNKEQRCDKRGIPILKGSKKHKIFFCDVGEKPKPLIEVSHVDSYKRFNVLNTHGENSDRSCSCCIIF